MTSDKPSAIPFDKSFGAQQIDNIPSPNPLTPPPTTNFLIRALGIRHRCSHAASTHIIYSCVSVCSSICYGRSAETIWSRDTRCSISGYRWLEATAGQFLWVSTIALAIDKAMHRLTIVGQKMESIDCYCTLVHVCACRTRLYVNIHMRLFFTIKKAGTI